MSGWQLFPIFIVVMLILLFFVQYFFYLKVTGYLRSSGKPKSRRTAVHILFAVFNFPLLALLIWRPHFTSFPDWFFYLGVYPFYVWHFSLLMLFLVYLALKIVQFPFGAGRWIARKVASHPHSTGRIAEEQTQLARRTVLRQGLVVLGGTIFAGAGYGALRRNRYEITSVEVPVQNLPEVFRGFSIALISDIHSSVFMVKEQMQQYVDVVNSLGADLVAVPGDFVNSTLDEVYPFAEAFSALRAPHGVYGVLGNHDYFTRQVEKVASEVNNCGITMLRNSRVSILKNGAQVDLLGIDDTGNRGLIAKRLSAAMAGGRVEVPKVLLCHRPYYFDQFAGLAIDLTLSGHTHGGQVVFVKLGNDVIAPARMVSPYVAGLYSRGTSRMYVSRGIGTVGIPIRFNCPPEVTKITLVNA